MSKRLIYLADLTHTGQSVASNVFPLAVGLIANYIKNNSDDYEIELFKYPDDLSRALESKQPDLVGFSNYSWNCDLSYQYTEQIKRHNPSTVVIWGGPNYGMTDIELSGFWDQYGLIDFYLIKEGEQATLELLNHLSAFNFSVNALKASTVIPANAHYLSLNAKLVTADILSRVKNLDDIGSPYLSGFMDKFFDDVLIPMIHTTRGCPFSCTFCTEGNSYYNKVAKRTSLKEELEYIAKRRGVVKDLFITDANFGMYSEDSKKSDVIADVKDRFGWPEKILVSTGKNKKERVIEVAKKLKGSLSIAASLQSTNDEILKIIKRSNISSEALNVIVENSREDDASTYTEIILGLPNDSVSTHVQSLSDVINSGIGVVRMYQLILLPQTELATPQSRDKYGMKTVFRINPRSFGRYWCYGNEVLSVESEEICVATDTLSKEDYLYCRQLNLSVEVIHNTSMFSELNALCMFLNFSWFEVILSAHKKILASSKVLKNIYNDFVEGCFSNTFDSQQAVNEYFNNNADAVLADVGGTNEMSKGKARVVSEAVAELHDIVYQCVTDILDASTLFDSRTKLYLDQLKDFSLLRKGSIFDSSGRETKKANFNFEEMGKVNYQGDPSQYYSTVPLDISVEHTSAQKEYIDRYFHQYGRDVEGVGRILMRADMPKLFKSVEVITIKQHFDEIL